jgi:phosphoribosyl-ATP pyrophosphohydrolase
MTLDELYRIICDRRDHPREGSYTHHLLQSGQDEILKKVGEETIEVIIAAKGQGAARLVEETADLFYHVLVLLAREGVEPEEVMEELARRHKTQ